MQIHAAVRYSFMLLTKCSQSCNSLDSIKKVRAEQIRISIRYNNYSIYYGLGLKTHYNGLLASRSNNLSCLEVRR